MPNQTLSVPSVRPGAFGGADDTFPYLAPGSPCRTTTTVGQGEPPSLSRPLTRADCLDGPRPCPWVSCRWHMLWEHRGLRGMVTKGDDDVLDSVVMGLFDLPQTCGLDGIGNEPKAVAEIGEFFGVSRQAVELALRKTFRKHRHLFARCLGEFG